MTVNHKCSWLNRRVGLVELRLGKCAISALSVNKLRVLTNPYRELYSVEFAWVERTHIT